MSSQEQEAEERRLIIAYVKQMMEFFNLLGTFEIKEDWNEYNGKNKYFISFSHYRNFILFQKIDLINSKKFIEDIVEYCPREGDFPPVKSIHDLYLVITKLYTKYRKIGMSSYTEENNPFIKGSLLKKDYKLTLINTPSTIELNFNY